MVNSRAYTIACDEGEDEHLKQLAAVVDAKAREVLGSVGQGGRQRACCLMAALLIADEHNELTGKIAAEGTGTDEKKSLHLRAEQAEGAAADTLESAAKRLEDIAARLAHA